MRITSIRLRLALWNVGVLALVLAAFGGAIRCTDEARLTAIVDEELAHRADQLRTGRRGGRRRRPPPPPSLGRPDAGEWRPEPWGSGERRGGDWGRREHGPRGRPGRPMEPSPLPPRLLDPTGQSVWGSLAEGPWDREAFARALRGRRVYSTTEALGEPARVLSVPVLRDGQVAGVIQLALPLTGMYDDLARLSGTLLMLFPLALLVAALGGAFLTDRALRPVRRITQAAAQIGASDLSERLPVKGRDEFSELAATFNEMLGRLEQAFTRLARSLDQQRRFTADASHELRTPLTIIKANTSLALEEERSNTEYRRALAAVDRAADTTNRIVQDLLLLARGDAGQLRLDRRPTRIGEVLERAVELFRDRTAPTLTVHLSDPSLTVPADPHHLLRLFNNLLENAVRHTPRTGRITIAALAEEDRVVVRVRDTGEGIPPEHLPHVCDRFYRVDTARTRRQGGTGLGLAICQSIVDAHGGALTIESVVGNGTTVTVRLPGPVSVNRDEGAPRGEIITEGRAAAGDVRRQTLVVSEPATND